MVYLASGSVIRQMGYELFEGGSVAGLSDRQLLERGSSHAGMPPVERHLRGW